MDRGYLNVSVLHWHTLARGWSGRASAYRLMACATSLGIAAGPLVGRALGALYGLRPIFLVTASVLIRVALVVATTVREPAVEPAQEQPVATSRPAPQRLTSGARGRTLGNVSPILWSCAFSPAP
jgi:MFS family permease